MPTDLDWLAECRERAPAFVESFEDNRGEGRVVLANSACAFGCPRCVCECAVRKIIADWWLDEWSHAEASAAALTHAGRTYSHIAGRA